MSAISVQLLLKYTNQARTNPKKFSQYIKKQIDSFLDNKSLPLMTNCTYSTNQGKNAWIQAYEFVKNHKPLPPFIMNEGLNLAAMDHAIDMQINNFFGHSSSNGMQFSQRIQRRCGKAYGGCAQNLGSQFDVKGRDHALQTVLGLIIDDGVLNRGHRKTMFSDTYKYIGLYSVKVGNKYYTCMDFHSENLKTIDSSKNALTGKNQKVLPSNFVNKDKDQDWNKNFEKEFEKMKINKNKVWKGQTKVTNGDQKYVASKSTSTKTSTVNGKTTKVTTTKIKYSDGSTQQIVDQQTF